MPISITPSVSKEVPIGGTIIWPYPVLPIDTDWLLMNGQTFSAGDYPELATLNGGTTLPDWRFRFPLGAYEDAPFLTPPGVFGGTSQHSHTQPAHTHTQPTHTHTQPAHVHTQPTHTHTADPPATTSGGPSGTVQAGILGLLTSAASTGHTHSTNISSFNTGSAGGDNTGSAGGDNTGLSGGDVTGSDGNQNTGIVTHNPPFITVHFLIRGR